jgi:hypothetical protein
MKFLIFLSILGLFVLLLEGLGKLLDPYIRPKNIPEHPLCKIADQREYEVVRRKRSQMFQQGCCCSFNPATGLMMIGDFDTDGNMYGFSSSSDTNPATGLMMEDDV